MSGRVFQRRVEHAFFAWLANQADPPTAMAWERTPRNEPFGQFLRELNGATPRMITQPFFITIPERKDAEGKVQPAVKMVTMYGFAGSDDEKV